ncbi:YkgJ family cysteine cluster protein [Flavobacterium sp.]|uniref:YkgJ family cysteine cluster protein n=1 Tax=Flavobacterium sp. TaxID=239 RepID=UPI00261C82A6|nr:YkgJ family cysteine cluster protein [Flavobacterium sp.]
MSIDPRTGVGVTETSEAEMVIAERIRQAQQEAVSEVLLPQPNPELLHIVVNDAERFAEEMTKKHRSSSTSQVACINGCSHCCYQLVSVSAPEVFRIARYMNASMPTAQKDELAGRIRNLNKATRGINEKARVSIKKPCAFLNADGRCSIYEVRPLACAEFTSYNVQDCKRGQRIGFKPLGIIHEKARMVVFNAVRQGLHDGLAIAMPKADSKWLELTAAIDTVLTRPDAESEWLSGKDVFGKAHLNVPKSN